MRSSIAKLTNSPAKQENILPTVNVGIGQISADTAKNKKLKAKFDADMKAYQDSLASYENELKIHEIITNPKYHEEAGYSTENLKKVEEARKLYSENRKRGIIFPDDRTFPRSTQFQGVEDGDTTWVGYINNNITRANTAKLEFEWGIGDGSYPKIPTKQEITDVMKPTKPEEPRYDQELIKLDMRALKNISIPSREPELIKALPVGIRNDRYYTTERVGQNTQTAPKGDDGLPLVRLKDQAGNVVFTGSQTEYQEKYGDALQRGTKQYGQENLKRRLYPQGYTKK